MKKKIMKILSVGLMMGMIVGTNAFAAVPTRRETIFLDFNQQWNGRAAISRTGDYSTVYARCYSVYPADGGTDNYTKIQAKISTIAGVDISDVVTLNETATSNTSISIKEGYLSTTSIRFSFRGNNPDYSAYADVYQEGR
ncbi:MAG: hypothetical protein IJA27_06715 [Lachnospiraceae bacterium]|nr:hypothetical protein [Lachnospiraceae bacterium]